MNRLWINFHRLLGTREGQNEGQRRFNLIVCVGFIGYYYIAFPAKLLGPYFGYLFDLRFLVSLSFLALLSIGNHIFNWVADGYVKDGYTSEYYEGKIKSYLGAIGTKKGGNKLTKELTSTGIALGIIALFYFTNPTYDH